MTFLKRRAAVGRYDFTIIIWKKLITLLYNSLRQRWGKQVESAPPSRDPFEENDNVLYFLAEMDFVFLLSRNTGKYM